MCASRSICGRCRQFDRVRIDANDMVSRRVRQSANGGAAIRVIGNNVAGRIVMGGHC